MKRLFKQIGLVILILAAVCFYGRFFLDLFDVIKYKPPLSQSIENIVQINLLDSSGEQFLVRRSLTGEEMTLFIEELMAVQAGRYANDPVTEFGDETIKICYQDGGYDLLGDKVKFYDAAGESLNTRGWYYIPQDDLHRLFSEYLH